MVLLKNVRSTLPLTAERAEPLPIAVFGVGLARTCGAAYREGVDVEFSGEITWWRGPAPHHFVPMPLDVSADVFSWDPV